MLPVYINVHIIIQLIVKVFSVMTGVGGGMEGDRTPSIIVNVNKSVNRVGLKYVFDIWSVFEKYLKNICKYNQIHIKTANKR